MPPEESEGIILSRRRFSETSWTLRAFTREHGRIDLLAKGARRPKSPLYGRLDIFNRESLLVYERRGGDLDLLADTYLRDEHVGLRYAPAAFAAAGMLAEAARFGFTIRDPHPDAYDALAHALAALSAWGAEREVPRDAGTPAASAAMALWTMLAAVGYTPRLAACVGCGRADDPRGGSLSPARGGWCCAACGRRASGPRAGGLTASGRAWLLAYARTSAPTPLSVRDGAPLAAALAAYFGGVSEHPMASVRVWRALHAGHKSRP